MTKDPRESGAEGGKARAARLTSEQRSEIAKKAAAARWGADLPVAVSEGVLEVAGLSFPCAVLSDGSRVLTEAAFMETMGIYRSGALSVRRGEASARIPLSLAFKNLKPYVERHLGDVHRDSFAYIAKNGQINKGAVRAETIPKICEVWIDADRDNVLGKRQKLIAARADLLLRGLAHTGIVALVDEATGYQELRARDALARYLEQYVAKELRQWVRTFPRSFFEELCRLKGIPLPENMRLPKYFGLILNDLVYDRLAPGIRKELDEKNPRENGRRRNKHHQWLTEDVGNPRLLHHLGLLEGIGKAFEDGDWEGYKNAINRRLPKPHSSLPLFAELNKEEADRS